MRKASPGGTGGKRARPLRQGSFPLLLPTLLLLGLAPGCSTPPAPPPVRPASEGAFAFRDPRIGLSAADRDRMGPEAEASLARAMEILAADRPDGWSASSDSAAAAALGAGRKRSRTPAPFDLGGAYLSLRRGERAATREDLARLAAPEPGYAPAVEALADLDSADGRLREALAGYRRLARLLPGDARASARIAATREVLGSSLREEAARALAPPAPDVEAARRAALGLLDLDPKSPDGPRVLARVALAGGHPEDAWTAASHALELDPAGKETNLLVAEVASRTGRHAEAVAAWERLATSDPAFAPRAAEARVEARIQNLPDGARRAAQSPKLTRGQLAILLWGTVPEVKLAPATAPPEVAIDVVDHPERPALVRAISLGFLQVSRESHRVGLDAAVSRAEFASHLRREAAIVSGGRIPGCLAPDPPPLATLATCGILPESTSRTVTGREALSALDRVARLAREGGLR